MIYMYIHILWYFSKLLLLHADTIIFPSFVGAECTYCGWLNITTIWFQVNGANRLYVDFCFFVVQSLSCAQMFATPQTAASQSSLSFTTPQSLLKLMSIELVMPANHLILCHPLLLPSIFSSIRIFSSESAFHTR